MTITQELLYSNSQTGVRWFDGLIRVHSAELNQVDPVTRRVIGHARQHHEAGWLFTN